MHTPPVLKDQCSVDSGSGSREGRESCSMDIHTWDSPGPWPDRVPIRYATAGRGGDGHGAPPRRPLGPRSVRSSCWPRRGQSAGTPDRRHLHSRRPTSHSCRPDRCPFSIDIRRLGTPLPTGPLPSWVVSCFQLIPSCASNSPTARAVQAALRLDPIGDTTRIIERIDLDPIRPPQRPGPAGAPVFRSAP